MIDNDLSIFTAFALSLLNFGIKNELDYELSLLINI